MVLYNIVYYFGIVLFLFGLVSLFYFLYLIKKRESECKSFKEVVIKNKIKLSIPFLSFLIGFVLLNVAFYLDPVTSEHLADNNIEILWYHQAMVYIFGVLFVISLFSFIFALFTKLYLEQYPLKKKTNNIWLASSIISLLITFYFYGEGNAPYLVYPLANALYIGAQGIKIINVYRFGSAFDDGLVIYLYAIFILFGACLVAYVCDYKLYKEYGKHDLITNTFLVAFPCGVIGARIWYVVINLIDYGTRSDFYGDKWVNIFNMRLGGLAIMGGAVFGIIAGVSQVLIVKYGLKRERYKNFSLLKAADIIVPAILFAQAIGRIGNFFNNEVFGFPVDRSLWEWLPNWITNNMYYQHGDIYNPYPNEITDPMEFWLDQGAIELPLFFIEFCTNLIGYFVLEYLFRRAFKKHHSDGSLVGGYLIWYGLTRVVLEPMRNSSDMYNSSIVTAYIMFGAGVLLVAFFIFNNYYVKRNKIWWYKSLENNKESIEVKND